MSITKKAISVGMSAALIASLAATIAAPAAFASTAVTSAGVVPVGGTSTTAASFQFCENSAGLWNAGGTITVTISPYSAGGAVTFTNATGGAPAPTFSQNPGGLGGATVTAGGSSFTVKVPTDDGVNALCFTVTGLYISAAAGTPTGAINAVVTTTGATSTSTFTAATTSATGVLQTSQAATATTFLVNTTSTCPFVNVGTGTGPAGHYIINGVDTGAGGTTTALSAGQQTLTIAAAIGSATTAGQTVTQANVPNCSTALASPGTVGNAVTQTAVAGTANPGEQNQATGNTTITETAAGYLAAGTVLTFSISAPASGVTFSSSEWADPSAQIDLGNGLGQPALCVLNIGAMSCSVTVKTASTTVASSITLYGTSGGGGIVIDMASTVANGTAVNVTVTGSPAIIVNLDSNTIANASRVIVGTGAQPTIFINYNGQNSGMITLTEAGAGFFQASGANDAFGICINTGETFTYAPWAIVTNPTSGLQLLTSTSTGASQLAGTLYTADGKSCAMWSIYSASSSAAAVIDIVGATSSGPLTPGPSNGPTLSVPGNLAPGTTQMDVLVGAQGDVSSDDSDALSTVVSNATRVYKSGVTVTALSQPVIPPGTTSAMAGNLQITETLNGQFKAGEEICVVVLPRSTNGFTHQDTFLTGATTNSLPVIATNYATTGLLASSVGTFGACSDSEQSYFLSLFGVPLNQTNSFAFEVTQQAYNGLGQITVSNINYTTTADAPNGPVLVSVFSFDPKTSSGGPVAFQSNVSNAIIGTVAPEFLSATIGKGVTQTGPFGISTVVTTKGSYVTVKIVSQPSLAGAHVGIWIAKKVNGVWTKFSPHTGRIANGSGVVYYYYKAGSVATLAIRGYYSGDATHAAAWSNAVRVAYTK